MSSTRQNKVSRLIQKELASVFFKEDLDLPSGTLITITVVRVTADLSIARIYTSVLPTDKAEETINYLNLMKKKIRFIFGKTIRHQLREVPELEFFLDDSIDYYEKIDNLLK
jgi:ribosome-binding factor A